MLAELDRTGESQISLTDPDSRAMAGHTRVAVGYNVQVAVDTRHKLIVEQQVTHQVLDLGLLTQTAEEAKEILDVESIDVVADRGYFKAEDIEACEKAGMTPYVPRPQRGSAAKAGRFRKDEFLYDDATESYLCPMRQWLQRLQRYRSSSVRELKRFHYAHEPACQSCAIRARCTGNSFRMTTRLGPALEFRRIVVHPAHDGGVGHRQAALLHHLHQVPEAELEAQIPPHAQDDHLVVEVPPLEQILQVQEPGHRAALKATK